MKNIKINLIFIFYFIHILANSQTTEIFSIEQKNDFVKIDKIGNIYIVNGTRIIKYNSKGEKELEYSNPKLGFINQIDVSNPLSILVFYRTSQKTVRLDNSNSIIGNPINLQEYNIGEAIVIANGQDNGFWVFDEQNYQLIFIDYNGVLIYNSTSIKRLTNKRIENPEMGLYNNRIHLYSDNTLYIFDDRANLIEIVSIEGEELIINESGIYKVREKRIKKLKKGSQKFEALMSDNKEFDKFDCYFPYLLLSKKDKITLYLLTSEKPKTDE